MLQWKKMGFFSVEQETIFFASAVLWTRLRAMPVSPPGGTGNCPAEQLHSLAKEFVSARFGVKNGSAELAETGNVPTRLSQIKAKCT